MTSAEKILNQYEFGQHIFKKLFQHDSKKIKECLSKITLQNRILDMLNSNCDVVKITSNDKPYKIEINFYDTLTIDWMGVYFKLEHRNYEKIISFDVSFNQSLFD